MTGICAVTRGEWMARRQGPFGRGTCRAALVVLAMAALVLPAPLASASPETDAADAISQAWAASGGPTSSLGPADGGVYAVGEGFGQNYAAGKIFFTPGTGAHVMGGAILDKYLSLGGPADGDLGFPTIDEGPGKAPGSRNNTFSAGDKPVIFWTPDSGANVVRGAINAAWDRLGGSAGPLGVPSEDETYDGDVVTQQFTGGQLSWNRQTKVFTTVPPELAAQLTGLEVPTDPTSAINAARRAAGGPLGPLGAEQGGQYPIGADGAGQDFAGGKILFSPATGANVLTGPVLVKYESAGGPQGDLGFPTSSEADGGLAPASRVATFSAADNPVIFWTPDHGAFIVRGAMNAAWAKLGGATGTLGAPESDQTDSGGVVTQTFTGGEVSWNTTTGKFSTSPASLAGPLAGLQVPGQDLPKSPAAVTPNGHGGKAFTWHWWYWPIVIAAAFLLVTLVLLAVLAWRHRGRRRDTDDEPAPVDYERDPAGLWSPHTDVDPDTSRSADGDIDTAEGSSGSEWQDHGLADPPHETPGAFDADDPDAIDTAPLAVVSEDEFPTGRHSLGALAIPTPPDSTPAADSEEPDHPEDRAFPRTAIHLPLTDPHQAPPGYPIKGNVHAGLYHTPYCASYDDGVADIWFATEELAQANGFTKGD
jgi:uncharacterized protein with LGFP repeats